MSRTPSDPRPRISRQIAILPFENMDFSQFRESLEAAALICGLEPSFASDFYLTCDVSEAERTRKQRDAARVITLTNDQLKEAHGEAKRSLLVTNQDIFSGSLGFVFGLANREMGVALMSTSRLTQWEEGLTPSRIQERIMKEAAHEIGHLCGLLHCGRAICVMSDSKSLEQADSKLPMFCAECSRKLGTLGR